MGYPSLARCVADLERTRQLVRVRAEVDPELELAEIQRRLYAAQGPAVLFENVKGTPFPLLANLYGTLERARFLFRDAYARVQKIVQLKAEPREAWRAPFSYVSAPFTALRALPRRVRSGPVFQRTTSLAELPALRSWPDDGGPFVTLPIVITEEPGRRSALATNLGMYRVQLGGNAYAPDEIGLHFQLHRGIGVHYGLARDRGETLPVTITVGGPPSLALAAVMPLPEGLSEFLFAGMLGKRRVRYARRGDHLIPVDADFAILARVTPGELKPEGPFGDHLGYYAKQELFPYAKVEAVLCRKDAIWPFTVVGRPPQEDTSFGKLIHELTAPMVPRELPGVHALHAVDAAGVHPLMLALGSERYLPYQRTRTPKELLTQANAILGFGQASLAKFLIIAAREDDPQLHIEDEAAFLTHVLRRVDWTRDLHFQTRTSIDTLDYSGSALHEGSKLVIAACGEPRRELARELPRAWSNGLPGVADVRIALPGIAVLELAAFPGYEHVERELAPMLDTLAQRGAFEGLPLLVLTEDARFAAASLANLLWVTFTRSNPSHDVHGVASTTEWKHWGCKGPLVLDARRKPQHAPPLVEDPAITRRVDALAARGGPLHGIL
ncbi:MAG: UbiD family decarboxylase [Planctomycetes bacterium]|nr:UbiD family decarboxylase [Planctomycetota bacterium]